MKLTEKQKRFADEYIRCGNATQAAIYAGYSKKTARSVGYENLTKPHIKEYIDKRLKSLSSKRIVGMTEALENISKVARGEPLKQSVVLNVSDDGTPLIEVDYINADIDLIYKANVEMMKRWAAGNKDALQEKLLQAQINKLMAETKNEETGARTIIVTGEEEMRRVLNERSNKHH